MKNHKEDVVKYPILVTLMYGNISMYQYVWKAVFSSHENENHLVA